MRERAAVAMTIIWVVGALVFLTVRSGEVAAMSPNEWGDFFAGVFSPIALLWLVLGYFQQGEELRLQVEELRRSVEQQKELASATKYEVELSRLFHEHQMEKEDRDAQPRFVVSPLGCSKHPPSIMWFEIRNRGAHITDIGVSSDAGHCLPSFVPTMEHGGVQKFQVRNMGDDYEAVMITISYIDAAGKDKAQDIHFVYIQENENYSPSAPMLVTSSST